MDLFVNVSPTPCGTAAATEADKMLLQGRQTIARELRREGQE